ncbi:hypothetical protein HanIR_Chr05g0243761 [Helianthus annuus]|nr:hypothetical protein HanIR_Chr05g0243761 [Helianthus annuus]
MVQKRQLAEEAYDVSSKHLKLENSCQLVSCLEFPSKDVPLKPCSSAKGGHFPIENPENNRQFESGIITDKPTRLVPTDDAYSCLLRFPPLKEVPWDPNIKPIFQNVADMTQITMTSFWGRVSSQCPNHIQL